MTSEVFPIYVPGRTGHGVFKDYLNDKRLPALVQAIAVLDIDSLAGGGRASEAQKLITQFSLDSFEWDPPYVLDKPTSTRRFSCDDPMCARLGLGPGPHTHTSPLFHIVIDIHAGDLNLVKYRPGRGGGPSIDPEFVAHNGSSIIVRFPEGHPDHGRSHADGVCALLEMINADIESWNSELPEHVDRLLDRRTARAKDHATMAAAAGFPVRSSATKARTYRIPDRKRDQISTPSPAPSAAEAHWQLSRDDFGAVLEAIRTWADAAERTQGVVAGRGEEQHRNSLLAALRVRFADGAGEAFSVQGKTDLRILVRLASDSATGTDQVFHAECKIWNGPSSVDEALTQLVERYSTYRDRLGALIFFIEDRTNPHEVSPKAVRQMIEAHAGSEVTSVAGWPVLRIPDPKAVGWTVDLAIVVVDVQRR